MQDVSNSRDLRFRRGALEALQESAEMYLVEFLGEANTIAVEGKRVTLMQRDMKAVARIRNKLHIL